MNIIPRSCSLLRLILAVLLLSLIVSAAPDKIVTGDLLAGLQKQLLKKDDILKREGSMNPTPPATTTSSRHFTSSGDWNRNPGPTCPAGPTPPFARCSNAWAPTRFDC